MRIITPACSWARTLSAALSVALSAALSVALSAGCGAAPEQAPPATTATTARAQTESSSYPLRGRFEPIMMLAKYAQEGGAAEQSAAEESAAEESAGEEEDTRVVYWSDAERAAHLVGARGGLLVDPSGEPLDPDLDNPKHKHRTGAALFVMDLTGNIYFTFDQRYGLLHHSSLAAGGPVAAAGELVVLKGELVSVSNASGHYRPPPSTIDLVWARLVELGVNMSRAERFEVLGDPDAPLPERLPPPPAAGGAVGEGERRNKSPRGGG